jgi:vancomycin resistance protein YoaR
MAGVAVLALFLVIGLAWLADSTLAGDDTAARGAAVAGRDVGGMSEADIQAVLNGLNTDLSLEPVTVTTPNGTLETTAGDLGVTIDTEATTESILDLGRTEPLLSQPVDWVGGLIGEREAPVTYRVNRALVEYRLRELVAANETPFADPTIEPTAEGWQVVPGQSGATLDTEALVEGLAEAVRADGLAPVELTAEPRPREPAFTDEQAQALADEANRLTGRTLPITVEGQTADATDDVLRSFFTPTSEGGELALDMDGARVREWLSQTFSSLRVEPTDAGFQVGFGVTTTPSAAGRECCTQEAPSQLREALDTEAASLTLQVRSIEPSLTTEEANALGVVEPVATFTTNHAGGEGRVQNIHRFADLVRGAVILPGESFSANERVGQRTEEKGFVEAGAIYAGVYVQDVGGGVSQFATTLFNAAFFAGLDYDEYQSHSIYISRYPYGREATISWPAPDLKIRNDSPYGVLIWPTYTETSITVTLFSTKWVNADQTAQSERGIANGCTRVTTERTRVFLDEAEAERIRGGAAEPGSPANEVKDTVFAIYQPSEGVLC